MDAQYGIAEKNNHDCKHQYVEALILLIAIKREIATGSCPYYGTLAEIDDLAELVNFKVMPYFGQDVDYPTNTASSFEDLAAMLSFEKEGKVTGSPGFMRHLSNQITELETILIKAFGSNPL